MTTKFKIESLLIVLLIMSGCNSGFDNSDFESRLVSLEKINSKVLTLKNLDTLNRSNALAIVKGIMGNDTLDLHTLESELMLRDIKYHDIGGLEYYFSTGVKWEYQYYMLYSIDSDQKEHFINYEQYSD